MVWPLGGPRMSDADNGTRVAGGPGRFEVPWAEGEAANSPGPGAAVAEPTSAEGPTEEAQRLAGAEEELNALFRDFFRPTGPMHQTPSSVWRPPTDVFETAEEVVVKMDVAGVRKEDLEVTFSDQRLRIRGRREERFPDKKVAVSQMEVEYGVFERNITIRHPVDVDRIEATYNDGFLVVRIPKRRRRRGGGPITVIV